MALPTPSQFRFNRRQFLTLTAAGIPAAWLLSACVQVNAPAATAPAASTEATAGDPQRGGTLRVALQEAPGSLDPHMSFSIQDAIVRGLLYEPLVWNDQNLQAQPALATAWEAATDQLSWTLQLRQGVTFQHGTPFTAEDVVYTFARILGPDFGSSAQTAFKFIEKVEAVDDYTVRFILKSPNVDLPLLLGDPINAAIIIPHDRTPEELTEKPSGTGLFSLQEFVAGESATFARNATYWQTGLPYLDEVKLLVMPEMATQVAALASGALEMITMLKNENIPEVEGNAEITLVEVNNGAYQPIIMRLDQEPFTDVRVRQAFKYATDRQGMVQGVLQGRGLIGNDQPIPPVHPFAADLPAYPHDIEKAKALLAEAGYADGLEVTLYTADVRPGMLASAVVFQEMAKAAGITVTVEQVPGSTYWAEHYMKSALTVSNWNVFPSVDTVLTLGYHSTGLWNESGITNAELDTLIEAGRAETDPAKRKEIYAKAQQIIQEEGGTLVPYFRPSFHARHNNLQGMLFLPDGPFRFHEAWLKTSS